MNHKEKPLLPLFFHSKELFVSVIGVKMRHLSGEYIIFSPELDQKQPSPSQKPLLNMLVLLINSETGKRGPWIVLAVAVAIATTSC